MSISDIYNFIQIDELIATAGQPSAEQLRMAHDAGYEVVINLAPDGLDTSLPEEQQLLENLGIEYHHVPVAWAEPGFDQLESFKRLMEAAAGRQTLIHCQANYRVTVFFALYAMAELDWTEAQADDLIARIWNANPGYQMDETWKGFIAAARQRLP